MGIIVWRQVYKLLLSAVQVREVSTGEITFYMKGADVVMSSIVQYSDWLEVSTRSSHYTLRLP